MSDVPSIKFDSPDYRDLIDVLIEVIKITEEDGVRPCVEVGDKKYSDLLKLSELLQFDEPLQDRHQAKVDAIFQKKQHGYGRTAYNLVHRANSIASNRRTRLLYRGE